MQRLMGMAYRNMVKPLLFKFSADTVHEFFITSGEMLGGMGLARGIVNALWAYQDNRLSQTLLGIRFENPIGLSAGFDYDARLTEILPSVGFGFHTVGTVTHGSYEGNARPMLGRLPRSQSLLVNKGFKSAGMKEVLTHVGEAQGKIPLGISIGATNTHYENFDQMVQEISVAFEEANRVTRFAYFELNISCPNLVNIKDFPERFDNPIGLKKILDRLAQLNLTRPVFIKMPLEKTFEETKALLETAAPFEFVRALIFANLAKDRSNPAFNQDEIANAGKGNFSGKPTEAKSNALIQFTYKNYKGRFVIIGCGGVFTAEDAYKKIRLGASLIQLITGMIYMGPQQIGLINKGLSKLLARDGYKNIAEAVGTGN